jgi:GYF domain 2
MSDQWYYSHDQAVHGPVSGDDLRRLVQSGGLIPEDLVWPVGWEPLDGVPAEAALRFPEPPPVDPTGAEPARALPAWLPYLAEALRSGDDLAALPPPGLASWLPDVQATEGDDAR